jgi:molybdopterin synthase catalytic subunit
VDKPAMGGSDGLLSGDDWIELRATPLPVAEVVSWVVQPGCGGFDCFCGTVRNHAEGRPGVERLEYEAYEPAVVPRLSAIAAQARRRWPEIGRLALLHRIGPLAVGEVSVVVAVSTPHRHESFEATRFCIDTLKATVPIWKREIWADGEDWGLCAHELSDATEPSSS